MLSSDLGTRLKATIPFLGRNREREKGKNNECWPFRRMLGEMPFSVIFIRTIQNYGLHFLNIFYSFILHAGSCSHAFLLERRFTRAAG